MADPGYLSSQKDGQEEGEEPGLHSETLPQNKQQEAKQKERRPSTQTVHNCIPERQTNIVCLRNDNQENTSLLFLANIFKILSIDFKN